MIPRRVRLKGFLSYRTEVAYDFDDAQLWMLCGDNGAGKSSVFDAITFALYGLHRGGKQNVKDLINAHSDDLEVEFDFAVAGQDYRIRRTASRNGSPTFYAARLDGVGETATGEFDAETDKKDGLNAWVLDKLGLDEKTFISSVLLRQGEGDKIVTVQPKERFDMLKSIVNLSRYQELHEKAALRHNQKQGVANELQRQLAALAPTDRAEEERLEQEVARLEEEISAIAQALGTQEAILLDLAGWIVHARHWETLTKRQKTVQAEMAAAQDLLDREAEIRGRATRLAELNAILPTLALLHKARTALEEYLRKRSLHQLETRDWARKLAAPQDDPDTLDVRTLIDRLSAEIKELGTLETTLLRLEGYAEQRKTWHTMRAQETEAEAEMTRLAGAIARLDPEREAASQALSQAENHYETCKDAARVAVLERNGVEQRLDRFHNVESKPICDYCGLQLTAEHLEAERLRLQITLEQAITAENDTKPKLKKALDAHETARSEVTRLEGEQSALQRQREQVQRDVGQAQKAQKQAAAVAEQILGALPADYKNQIAPAGSATVPECFANAYPTEENLIELKARRELLPEKEQQARNLNDLKDNCKVIETHIENHDANIAGYMQLLLLAWKEIALTFTPGDLHDWKQEAGELRGADDEFQALQEAERKQEEHCRELEKIETDIKAIPKEAQRNASELEAEQKQDQDKLDVQRKTLSSMEGERQKNADRLAKILDLSERSRVAASEVTLHKTLCDCLGRDGLQRHLLRQAEHAIVAHADETLRSISGGMLHLELREGGKDKALDIVVHNLETGSKPLPVGFLSGSQKFRVAVSLALGIGQYASQGDQRIQSVIIDEGFGSLDKRARGNMIYELQALTNRLERIIVVSHQDDVAEAFRDRYHIRLEGETSVAERIMLA